VQLEQYFDLIVFAAYVEDEEAGLSGVTFSSWLKASWLSVQCVRGR
jgi:hypothetical protein